MQERGASVALILSGEKFVLIRRVQRAEDPWSGNYALPGGMIKPNESPAYAVLREVMEEVGLSFHKQDISESLPVAHPVSRPELTVYPFVIRVPVIGELAPGDEVAEARIFSMGSRIETTNPENGFPAFNFGGWIVWGLTYRILLSYLNRKVQKS